MVNLLLMIVGIVIIIGGMIAVSKLRDIAQFGGLIVIILGWCIAVFNLLSIMFTFGA